MKTIQPLSQHRRFPKITKELALLQQQFYGRRLHAFPSTLGQVSIQFKPADTAVVGVELDFCCGGLDYQVQIVDPHAVLELGAALAKDVPLHVQSAAFLYAAQPILLALEKVVGSPARMTRLSCAKAAASQNDVLGLVLSITDTISGQLRQTSASIHALQPQGWRRLGASCAAFSLPQADLLNPALQLSVQCRPITITLADLRQMAPGDVLLLNAGAQDLQRQHVYLALNDIAIPGWQAVLADNRLKISHAEVCAHGANEKIKYLEPWSKVMKTEDHATTVNTNATAADGNESDLPVSGDLIDGLQVTLCIELARLTMPISSLRNLAVGQVFVTHQTVDGETVSIYCSGQRLGVGQLVAIGERLGVRITALEAINREKMISNTLPIEQIAQTNGDVLMPDAH